MPQPPKQTEITSKQGYNFELKPRLSPSTELWVSDTGLRVTEAVTQTFTTYKNKNKIK